MGSATIIDSWPYDERRFLLLHRAERLLAGEPRAALQPAVRAAAARVLPDPRGPARARPAPRAERRGRDPARPVHRRRRHVGPAALHGLPHRRGAVARGARPARPRLTSARRSVRRDGGRVSPARAAVRAGRGQRDVGRARVAAGPDAFGGSGARLVDPAHGLAGRGDLRGAAVPGGAGRPARGGGARPARLASGHGRHGGHAARRRDLLRLPLYRTVRRPLAALFVRVPNGGGAVLLGALPAAGVRDHGVDARAVRRVAAGARSRSLKRWILPVAVFGSSFTNTIQRGYL